MTPKQDNQGQPLDKAFLETAQAMIRFTGQVDQSTKGMADFKKRLEPQGKDKVIPPTPQQTTPNQAKSPVEAGLGMLLKSLTGGAGSKPDSGSLSQIQQEEEMRQSLALEAERKVAEEGHKLKLGYLAEYAQKALKDTKDTNDLKTKSLEAASKLMEGDKKGAMESLGNLAGSSLGGMYGGPAGAAVGGAVGTMAGAALGGMFGGGDEPKTMGNDFESLRKSLADFEKQLREGTKSLEQNLKSARRLDQKIDDRKQIGQDLEQQKKQASEAALYAAKNKDYAGREAASEKLQDNKKAAEKNKAALKQLRQQRAELHKKLTEYSVQLDTQIKDVDTNRKKFFQDRKEAKFTATDWNKELKQARHAMDRMQERPKGLVDEVAWQKKLLDLKEQESKALQAYIQAKDQEIEQLKATQEQLKQLGKGVEDWRQGKQRQNWGSADWMKEFVSLDQQLAKLNPKDKNYQKDLVELQQKQFQALQNIDSQQGKELEETKKLVKTLQDAQKTAIDARDRLALKGMNSEQQLGYYDEQYQKLLNATQSGTEEERAKAVTDFSAFTDTYLSQYQAQFKSGSQYQAREQMVLGHLDQLISGLQGQIDQGNASIETPGVDVNRLTNYLLSGIDQSNRNLNLMIKNVRKEQNAAQNGEKADLEKLKGRESTLTQGAGGTQHLGLPQRPATAALPVFTPLPPKQAAPKAGPNLATPVSAVPAASSRLGQGVGLSVEQRLDQQIRLLGELIDVERAKGSPVTKVLIDGQELQKGVLKHVSEGNRRGMLDLGV